MKCDQKILSTLIVISFLLIAHSSIADNNYELVDSPEMTFDVVFKDNLFNGVVCEFSKGTYIKIKNTTVTSFTYNSQKLELKSNKIDDGFVETKKYGNIKIGIKGPPPQKVIVWLTLEQKKAFQELNSSKQNQGILPDFGQILKGNNEVRIKNPNDFEVTVGLRSRERGKDFDVAANGIASVFVPDGAYQIYFVYSNKPDALFQGDDFSLNNKGIEIKIIKVVGGNYGIKQVK